MAGDIFSLAMEGRCDRHAVFARDLHSFVRKKEGCHKVADIGVMYDGAQGILIRTGYDHAVLLNVIVEYTEIYFFYDVKSLVAAAVLVRADDAHVVSFGFERAYKIHCGDRCAVVFLTEHVADNGYFH